MLDQAGHDRLRVGLDIVDIGFEHFLLFLFLVIGQFFVPLGKTALPGASAEQATFEAFTTIQATPSVQAGNFPAGYRPTRRQLVDVGPMIGR